MSSRRSGAGASKRSPPSLRSRAIALLARRDYSRAELRQKLSRLAQEESSERPDVSSTEQLEALLDELAQLGYLSDDRYAKGVVARKSASHSRRAIAEELKARGVGGEAVAAAIAASEADDAATLQALWQRRFGAAPRDDRDKARQVRFLQSRGFALSAILRFLRDLPPADDLEAT